jgi:hypothetical protein
MSNVDRPLAALRVPTLTEVVAVAEPVPVADPGIAVEAVGVDLQLDDMGQPLATSVSTAAPREPAEPPDVEPGLPTEGEMIQQVLADVSRQVELMLEYRMREALAPILARATDTVIRDTRTQLANTLHEMVARAVAQEMARHRDR